MEKKIYLFCIIFFAFFSIISKVEAEDNVVFCRYPAKIPQSSISCALEIYDNGSRNFVCDNGTIDYSGMFSLEGVNYQLYVKMEALNDVEGLGLFEIPESCPKLKYIINCDVEDCAKSEDGSYPLQVVWLPSGSQSNFQNSYDNDFNSNLLASICKENKIYTYNEDYKRCSLHKTFEISAVNNPGENNPTPPNPPDPYKYVEKCEDADPINYIKACGCIPAGVADISSKVYYILRVIGPIMLIIIGGIEMAKAVSSQDESAIEKSKKKLVNKAIAAAMIFLVLTVVKFGISIVRDQNQTKGIYECVDYLLNGYEI